MPERLGMVLRNQLRKFINHTITEIAIGILIIASVSLTIFETKTTGDMQDYCEYAAHIINAIFVVELLIRFWVARSKTEFFKSFWLDIIAVVPVSKKLRVLRIVRLLRLIRLGVLFTRRTRRAAAMVSKGLAENMLIVVTLVIILLIGVIGIPMVEKTGYAKAVWYSLYTLMAGEPVGDVPGSIPGKIITMILMIGGFTMFAIFTGVVSAVMIQRLRGGMEMKDLDLEELVGHYVICGWNRSVPTILRELQASSETRETPIVIVAELDEEPEYDFPGINRGLIFFVKGDFSSTAVLRRVRVEYADRAILLADKSKDRSDQDRDARTILAALTIEKMRSGNVYSCVELLNRDEQKVKVLEMAGVEDIVEGDEYMGNLVGHTTRAYGLAQVLDELLTSTWGNEFSRVSVPEDLVGATFLEVLDNRKRRRDELVIAVVRDQDGRLCCTVNPSPNTVVHKEDELIIIRLERNCGRDRSPAAIEPPAPSPPSEEDTVTLEQISSHYLICGWNRSASRVIAQLRQNIQTQHAPIVVIAETAKPPVELNAFLDDPLIFFVPGDYSSTSVLEEVRVGEARSAILLADKTIKRSDQDRDARTILAALTIEKMNASIHSCAELLNRDEEKIQLLEMANVEDIVVGDEYVGNLIAHATRTQGLVHVMNELLTSNVGNEFRKISIPPEYVGKSFGEALVDFKSEYDSLVMAVESRISRDGAPQRCYVTNPSAEMILKDDDSFFVITGNFSDVEVFG